MPKAFTQEQVDHFKRNGYLAPCKGVTFREAHELMALIEQVACPWYRPADKEGA